MLRLLFVFDTIVTFVKRLEEDQHLTACGWWSIVLVVHTIASGVTTPMERGVRMAENTAVLTPPSDDKRWRIVQTTMRRHGFAPDALIETLHSAQEAFGYLDDASLRFVATSLKLPLSRVYGVATFYNLFTLKPQGVHTCVVCLGTACYIQGGPKILAEIEKSIGLRKGETTSDKQISLLVARCLGTCGLAPAVVFDGEIDGKVTPDTVMAHLKEWMVHEPG